MKQMNKVYIEICYTYEDRSSFLPPIAVAIVEVESKDVESIDNLVNKAIDKLKEKYPDKMFFIFDSRYLGHTLEIITF